jgi:uncharacterized RDD family membrane protein YckC
MESGSTPERPGRWLPPEPPTGPPPPPPGPEGPQAPPGAPPYTGPVPPGGWAQPPAPAPHAFAGAPLASWGSRAGALLLDVLVILGVSIVLFAPGGIILGLGPEALGIVLLALGGLGYVAMVVLYPAYFMQREGPRNGQTLGKQWVGIRVVRDTTEPFGFGQALLREFVVKIMLFGWVGGSFFLAIPSLLDHLWPLWEDENRALHDLIVKTHVVRA